MSIAIPQRRILVPRFEFPAFLRHLKDNAVSQMRSPLGGAGQIGGALGVGRGVSLTEYTLTLQPDAAAGMDTYLDSVVTANHGSETTLFVGAFSASRFTRALIKFDLSSIPSNAILQSVVFSIFRTADFSSNARTFRVYRQKRAWTELGATFTSYDGSNNWQTAGGFGTNDCEQTDIGSCNFTATEGSVFKDFILTPTTKAGLDLGNGWMVKADTEDTDAYQFASSDHATAANRPKLVITYLA